MEDDEKVELIKEPVDPEEEKRQLEEEKRLHKAREVSFKLPFIMKIVCGAHICAHFRAHFS